MDTRTLSPKQQELLRMRVMAAIDDGLDDQTAAWMFGVSTRSIGRWRARRAEGGDAALRSGVPGVKPGQGRYLSPSQEAAVKQTVLDFVPEDLGLGGLLWTRDKIASFISEHFGVAFTRGGMSKLLARLGLSFQRPDKRAREADPAALAEWTEQTWPAIRARARAEGAAVFFGDQVGARSDHLSGRTWGERGTTPILARTGKRFGLNAMSAISPRGKLYFTVFGGKFDAGVCIAFLDSLIGHFAEQKVHLVLDGHSVHKSKAVRKWVAAHPDRIELHFLPPYAPHLNPDELVNADLKRHLADKVITCREELLAETRVFLRSVQHLPSRIVSYVQARYTKYVLDTIEALSSGFTIDGWRCDPA